GCIPESTSTWSTYHEQGHGFKESRQEETRQERRRKACGQESQEGGCVRSL
ncbi:hypothetical protein, partial [Pseudomonas sp. FEN]